MVVFFFLAILVAAVSVVSFAGRLNYAMNNCTEFHGVPHVILFSMSMVYITVYLCK